MGWYVLHYLSFYDDNYSLTDSITNVIAKNATIVVGTLTIVLIEMAMNKDHPFAGIYVTGS